MLGAADGFEQAVVLHVAGADLENVGVFADDVDVFGRDDFGDNREAGFVAGRGEHFQAFFFEALESVGAGARFERAAAEGGRAGLLDRAGRADDLLFAFDGAGAGDDAECAAADGEAAGADDAGLGFGFDAGELVRRENGEHFVNAGAAFENADRGISLVANRGDHGALGAAQYRGLEAE